MRYLPLGVKQAANQSAYKIEQCIQKLSNEYKNWAMNTKLSNALYKYYENKQANIKTHTHIHAHEKIGLSAYWQL